MNSIPNDSVLNAFCQNVCLDLRKLAVLFGVASTNATLAMVIGNLERTKKSAASGAKVVTPHLCWQPLRVESVIHALVVIFAFLV